MWSISLIWIDSKTARTATGSTAARRDAKTRQWSSSRDKIQLENPASVDSPESEPNEKGVEESSDDGVQEYGAEVVEEGSAGHEVARIEDDRWKEDEEKDLGVEVVVVCGGEVQDYPQNHPDDDEQATLGEEFRQFLLRMES